MTDYPRPRYHIDSAGLRHFAGYDRDSGSYVYDSGTRRRHAANVPDPELELYTAITGRHVTASYTHAAWRNEYTATGQSIAMERMLALVTETTYCDALDGPEPVPAMPAALSTRIWQARGWIAMLAFCVTWFWFLLILA